MKLLVFAHTPPPHHGQSYMVELMLKHFGGDRRKQPRDDSAPGSELGIECYHVNARLSKKLEDIGDFQVGKFLLLLGYCLQAIWCRFRYRVHNLYYIPAPGKPSALYRDWLVLFICRPFFRRLIFHWHAAGIGKWLELVRNLRTRSWTYRMLGNADLSIVLSEYNRTDAQKLWPKRVDVVFNGIIDPCPGFATEMLTRRKARLAARKELLLGKSPGTAQLQACGKDPALFKVLYLAHCTREKGLFDTLNGVALANHKLAQDRSPLRMELTVAGEFISEAERGEFNRLIADPGLQMPAWRGSDAGNAAGAERAAVRYAGFVSGAKKTEVLAEADCFCFPTYYYAESFGLVILEAMSFGVPVVTTRWRSIPELLPIGYEGFVEPRSPGQVAEKLLAMVTSDFSEELRRIYAEKFTLHHHINALADALNGVERPGEPAPRDTSDTALAQAAATGARPAAAL